MTKCVLINSLSELAIFVFYGISYVICIEYLCIRYSLYLQWKDFVNQEDKEDHGSYG